MGFQAIQGPDGPEDFVWEVSLSGGQELRQLDDQHAGVYYPAPDEALAFTVTAIAAHDASGASVPTTLSVTQPNLITLTVHHRAGNAAAGGAPFDYPIESGIGGERGYSATVTVMPTEERPPTPQSCTVPDLSGRTLRASRKILHRAHCKLGRVRGERNRAAHVVQQYRLAGNSLPAWAAVDVKVS